MQRLKDWTVEDLNEEQKEVHDEIVNGPRGKVVGPLRIWLNNPKLAKVAQQVGPTYTDDAGVLRCGVDKDTTIPSSCVPLNIFGVNSVTDEMIAYSSDNATVGGLNVLLLKSVVIRF